MTFDSLGLNETLLKAVAESGYTTPTEIQQKAIPAILAGKDVMAVAQTGTGKTAGFTLPILQLLGKGKKTRDRQIRVLVLTPTRELALQVQESIDCYGKYENQRSLVICGGVNINPQKRSLLEGSDILVATPGRLLDLYQQKAVRFDDLQILVLDEADRMLDMGFIRDIRKLISLMPKQRQNLLFSATFSDDIRELARGLCPTFVEIDAAPRNSTVQRISQQVYMTRKEHKLPLLATLLKGTDDQVLVFSRTKHGANNLVKKLKAFSVTAAAIHGNKSQAQRVKALGDFKENRVQVLIATDIAARGIDIDKLAMVINFDLPNVAEDYVHRIGRTGRAGASGLAVSLVTPEDNSLLHGIERFTKQKIERAQYREADLLKPLSAEILAEMEATEAREQQEHDRMKAGFGRQQSAGRSGNRRGRGRGRGGNASESRTENGNSRASAARSDNRGNQASRSQEGRENSSGQSDRRRQGEHSQARQAAGSQSGEGRSSRRRRGRGGNGNQQATGEHQARGRQGDGPRGSGQGEGKRGSRGNSRNNSRNSSRNDDNRGNREAPAAAASRRGSMWNALKSLIGSGA